MKNLILLVTVFISMQTYALTKISLKNQKSIHTITEEYLSVGLDTAQIVGSFWWDKEGEMTGGRGKNKTTPLNLDQPLLNKHFHELSPLYLRIGGSEADALFYDIEDKYKKIPKGYDSILTKKMWTDLQNFLNRHNSKLFFTLNQGPSSQKNGKWNTENLNEFLMSAKKNLTVPTHFELGNEVFAYWAIFGLDHFINEKEYAKNYILANKEIKKHYPKSLLAGPASAYWPIIGEPLGFIFNKMEDLFPILKNNYEIITWHYYPTQSFRCPVAVRRANKKRFLQPKTLDEISYWAKEILELKEKYSPNAQYWLGETGSAQCGGEPLISDQFISSFWWLDQLASMAKLKHDVIIRHNLIDADYALLNPDGSPRPDYYISYLWKKFMTGEVLDVRNNKDQKLRIYAHRKKDKEVIIAINISNKNLPLEINSNLANYKHYKVTTSDLFSQNIYLNDKNIQSLEDLKNQIKKTKKSKKQNFLIEKYSLNFIEISKD